MAVGNDFEKEDEMNELTFVDCQNMAVAVFKSGFMGVKSPDEALTLMMLAQAEGRHPATVQRDYHIISGKPTLKADTVLARFQESGGKVSYQCYTDEKCEMSFTSKNGEEITVDWDMGRAQRAGVTGNPTWKKYPRAMLRSRCIAEGVRAISPSVFCGMMATEEAMDISPIENKQVRNIGTVQIERKPLGVNDAGFTETLNGILTGKYTLEMVETRRDLTTEARNVILDAIASNEVNHETI